MTGDVIPEDFEFNKTTGLYQLNLKMADINSKYFSVLQSSNFKCGKTGKDEGFIGYFDVQLLPPMRPKDN